MKKSKHLLWEIILILSSVLIFRGFWTLLDRINLLNETYVHVILLVVGTVLFAWAMNKLIHQD
jgi:hypothetical protein